MTQDDTKQRIQLLNMLAQNYSAALDADALDLWLMLLAEYPLHVMRRAILGVIRAHGFEAVQYKSMPPFALVQKELDKLTGSLKQEESLPLMAEAEWGRLLDMCTSVGSYGSPQLHPTTAYVVRQMGGWATVCRWKEEELQWKHKDFVNRWQQCHGREEVMRLGADEVKRLASTGGMKSLSGGFARERLIAHATR